MLSSTQWIQFIIAISVIWVWTVRFPVVVSEFEHFGYSSRFRNGVGFLKLLAAVVLLLGVCCSNVTNYAALVMAVLMLGAQITHLLVKNPWFKLLPSLCLLLLSLYVVKMALSVHA